MAELRKCPFCGGEAEMLKYPRCEKKYVVVCKNNLCNASIGQYSTSKENAARAWNTRKPEEAAVAKMEKVAFERFGNDGMGGQKVVPLDDAISIVRGKE